MLPDFFFLLKIAFSGQSLYSSLWIFKVKKIVKNNTWSVERNYSEYIIHFE